MSLIMKHCKCRINLTLTLPVVVLCYIARHYELISIFSPVSLAELAEWPSVLCLYVSTYRIEIVWFAWLRISCHVNTVWVVHDWEDNSEYVITPHMNVLHITSIKTIIYLKRIIIPFQWTSLHLIQSFELNPMYINWAKFQTHKIIPYEFNGWLNIQSYDLFKKFVDGCFIFMYFVV